MSITEYNDICNRIDTQAINIYLNEGEEAYHKFRAENPNPAYPHGFAKDETVKQEEKKEWLPHIHKDEMQLLREQYYYDQHKEINLSNF